MKKVDLRRINWSKTRNSSGTPGTFLKAYEIRNNKKIYYKLSNYDQVNGIVGHECINEIIVDRLLTLLNIDHLSYELIKANVLINNKEYETYLCASYDYKEEHESKQAIEDYYNLTRNENEDKLDFLKRIGFINYVYTMFIVDFIIINRDRHGANIEILKHNNSKTYRLSPLFDHGMSFLFACNSEKEIKEFKPLADVKIQSYFGTTSLYKNLELIPKKNLIKIKQLTEEDKGFIFKDIEEIMPKCWMEKVWEIIARRIEYYENFRNKR